MRKIRGKNWTIKINDNGSEVWEIDKDADEWRVNECLKEMNKAKR